MYFLFPFVLWIVSVIRSWTKLEVHPHLVLAKQHLLIAMLVSNHRLIYAYMFVE